jgi:hypothetical protein
MSRSGGEGDGGAGEVPAALDGNPVGGLGAAVADRGWLPGDRVLIALGPVGGRGDRDQGPETVQVVGVDLAFLGSPGGAAESPLTVCVLPLPAAVLELETATGVSVSAAEEEGRAG